MTTVFFCSNLGLSLHDFNFDVIGKRYMLFLLCAIMLNIVKLQVMSRCSDQNIFILVDKMFNIFQYVLSDYSQIYWIFTLQKHVPKELSLQMMKNSKYSNSNLPNWKLRKPEVLHFRRELCQNTVHFGIDTGR